MQTEVRNKDLDDFSIATHNGCITMTNPVTGQHRTLRIRTQKPDANFCPGARILSLLNGPDNESDYVGFAFVNEDGTVSVWKRYKSRSCWAVYADMITRPHHYADTRNIDYQIEGRCRKCNRLLTDPVSISAGIGPVCVKGE